MTSRRTQLWPALPCFTLHSLLCPQWAWETITRGQTWRGRSGLLHYYLASQWHLTSWKTSRRPPSKWQSSSRTTTKVTSYRPSSTLWRSSTTAPLLTRLSANRLSSTSTIAGSKTATFSSLHPMMNSCSNNYLSQSDAESSWISSMTTFCHATNPSSSLLRARTPRAVLWHRVARQSYSRSAPTGTLTSTKSW